MCVSDMQMHMESFEETMSSKSGNVASRIEGKRPEQDGRRGEDAMAAATGDEARRRKLGGRDNVG